MGLLSVDFAAAFLLYSTLSHREREWNTAFNFSSDLSFLTACIAKTGGTFPSTLFPFKKKSNLDIKFIYFFLFFFAFLFNCYYDLLDSIRFNGIVSMMPF